MNIWRINTSTPTWGASQIRDIEDVMSVYEIRARAHVLVHPNGANLKLEVWDRLKYWTVAHESQIEATHDLTEKPPSPDLFAPYFAKLNELGNWIARGNPLAAAPKDVVWRDKHLMAAKVERFRKIDGYLVRLRVEEGAENAIEIWTRNHWHLLSEEKNLGCNYSENEILEEMDTLEGRANALLKDRDAQVQVTEFKETPDGQKWEYWVIAQLGPHTIRVDIEHNPDRPNVCATVSARRLLNSKWEWVNLVTVPVDSLGTVDKEEAVQKMLTLADSELHYGCSI